MRLIFVMFLARQRHQSRLVRAVGKGQQRVTQSSTAWRQGDGVAAGEPKGEFALA